MAAVLSFSSLFHPPRDPGRRVALRAGRWLSLGALERDVAGLTAELRREAGRGEAGGRWLLLGDDAYALAVGLLAALFARQTPVLPANLQPGHLAEISAGLAGALSHEIAAPPGLATLPILGREADAAGLPDEPPDLSGAELVLHTSGTTGEPLAIAKPLRCLEAEVAALAGTFPLPEAALVQATVPAHHIYGLLFRLLWPLLSGRPFAAGLIRFPGELALSQEATERTVLVSSPAFLGRALPVLDLDALGSRLGGLFSSGGPLPPEVAAAYNTKLATPIVEVYGSTETGGIGHRSVLDAAAPAPWTPLPGVEIAVDAESGALAVASPFLPDGGPFRTADAARLLPDGRFALLGRHDSVVKLEERRVSLSEVERRLSACPEVMAARVVLLESDKGRSQLGAVVVPTPAGWTALEASGKRALTATIAAGLAPYLESSALPRRWRFVRAIPETVQGKAPLDRLLALFADEPSEVTRPILLGREPAPPVLRLTFALPPELAYFDGHFDEQAILPGVVQLDWAIHYAREELGLEGTFRRIEALKFFRVLSAGDEVTLELRYDQAKRSLHFRYLTEARDHSAGRIVFEAAP